MSEKKISTQEEEVDIFTIPSTEESVDIEQQVQDASAVIDGIDIFEDEDSEEETEQVDQEDQEEGEEVEENEDEEQEDLEINETNLVPLLGAQLLKEGIIPEGTEITATTTHKDIYDVYKASIYEQVETDIFNRIQTKLTEDGITEENIYHAKLISTGTDPKVLREIVTDKAMSEQKFEGTESEENINLVKRFLDATNQGSKRISEKLLETALLDDDDFKELHEEGKKFFAKAAQEKEVLEVERNEQVRANREIIIKKNQDVVQSVISKGEVLGLKIPNIKKFTQSISENSEVIEIRGEQRRVTKLGKFLMEFNTNPELQIAAFVQHTFGGEMIEKAKAQGEQEGETNLLKNFSMVQDKGISKKKVTNLTNKKVASKQNTSYLFQTTTR